MRWIRDLKSRIAGSLEDWETAERRAEQTTDPEEWREMTTQQRKALVREWYWQLHQMNAPIRKSERNLSRR